MQLDKGYDGFRNRVFPVIARVEGDDRLILICAQYFPNSERFSQNYLCCVSPKCLPRCSAIKN